MSEADEVEITIDDLSEKGFDNFTFIDIREQDELDMEPCNHLEAEHRPMSEFNPENITLSKDRDYIIFCAKGGRSYQMCAFLHDKGYTNTLSLIGGTEAIDYFFNHKNSSPA